MRAAIKLRKCLTYMLLLQIVCLLQIIMIAYMETQIYGNRVKCCAADMVLTINKNWIVFMVFVFIICMYIKWEDLPDFMPCYMIKYNKRTTVLNIQYFKMLIIVMISVAYVLLSLDLWSGYLGFYSINWEKNSSYYYEVMKASTDISYVNVIVKSYVSLTVSIVLYVSVFKIFEWIDKIVYAFAIIVAMLICNIEYVKPTVHYGNITSELFNVSEVYIQLELVVIMFILNRVIIKKIE